LKIKLIKIILPYTLLIFFFSRCSAHKNTLKMKHQFETSYNQFYIINPFKDHGDKSDLWSDENYNNRIAVLDGFIALRTASYGNIDLEVLVLENENTSFDINKYDHIVEASIKVENGKLEIVDCPDSDTIIEIRLNDTNYRVRLYSKDIIDVDVDVDVDEDEGGDSYKIEIWPADFADLKIIKSISS